MEKGVEEQEAATVSKMPLPMSPSFLNPEEPGTEPDRFRQALLELKDLRSQLHHAAHHCDNAFLKASHRKLVLESTKSYICDAIVAMVDHLGNVSSKLERRLHGNIEVMQMEQKIDCLKQHPEKLSGISRDEAPDKIASKTPSEKDQWAVAICPSVAVATDNVKLPNVGAGITFSTAIPVLKGPSILPKPCNSSFGSYTDDVHLLLGVNQKKSMQGINFLSFFRMSKRKT